MSGVTRQSMRLGVSMALLAGLVGGGTVQGYAPGLNASTVAADQAARGQGSAQFGSALARILGQANGGAGRAWLPGHNGRAHTGVAAQRRAARKARRVARQKAVGRRWA